MNNYKLRLAGKMEEVKPERTLAVIQTEYNQLVWKYGNLIYAAKCNTEEADLLLPQLKALNQEGAEAVKKQSEAKAKDAVEPPIVEAEEIK